MMRLNKRAEEMYLSEIITIVISAICIAGLIYLGVLLYNIAVRDTAEKQAKAALEQIAAKINLLKDKTKTEYLIIGPKNWRIIPYEKELCICPESYASKEQEELCKNKGVCRVFDNPFKLEGSFTTCILPAGYTGKGEDMENCISLRVVPKMLYFNLESGVLGISQEEKTQDILGYIWIHSEKRHASSVLKTRASKDFFMIDLSPFFTLKESAKAAKGIQDYYFFLEKDKKGKQINFYLNDASSLSSGLDYRVGKLDSDNWLWIEKNTPYTFLSNLYTYSDQIVITSEESDSSIENCGLFSLRPKETCKKIVIYPHNIWINYTELNLILEKNEKTN